MPTTIDSMTGVEIKSPFFDTAVSLELFPVHPNVLKNPNAPQKNRVALIYGSNGSGKSTIAQGFREYKCFGAGDETVWISFTFIYK